jgi:hypothetical protein
LPPGGQAGGRAGADDASARAFAGAAGAPKTFGDKTFFEIRALFAGKVLFENKALADKRFSGIADTLILGLYPY